MTSNKGQTLLALVVGPPVSHLDPGKKITTGDVIQLWMGLSAEKESPLRSKDFSICMDVGAAIIKHWNVDSSPGQHKKVAYKVSSVVSDAIKTMKFTHKMSNNEWIQSQKELFNAEFFCDLEAPSRKRPLENEVR